MRRSTLLLAAALLFLAGCRSTTPPAAEVTQGTSASSASATELTIEHRAVAAGPADAADTPWSDTLVLSGPITATVVLRKETPGALWLLDAPLYRERQSDGSSLVMAGFTSYFAGGGMDVRLRRSSTTLWIEQRVNDRGARDVPEEGAIVGGCGLWTVLGKYPLAADVSIRLKTDAVLTTGLAFECKW